jgi:hypothetical protein
MMQLRKSPIAVAAIALLGALPLAAQAQSTPAPSSGALDVWFKAPAVNATIKGVLNGGTSCYTNSSGPVARVVFTMDGAPVNTDSTPSDGTQCVLDTTKFANGPHQLRADAFDASGNRKTDIRGVNIQNTATTTTGGTTTGGTTTSGTTTGGTTTGGTTTGGTTTGGTTTTPSYAGTPFSGSAITLPATIPAANFDKGGEGVAFHDLSAGNLGGLYRTSESVDIIASTDTAGGANQVTNFQTGEWMNYSINVPANASYDIGIRAANNLKAGSFHIEVDGVNVTGSVTVGLTGSWTKYQWFGKTGVALTAGKHVVRLVSDQQWFNVSALSLAASGTSSTGGTSTGGTTTGGTTTGGTTTGGTTTGGTTTGGTTTGGTTTGGTTTPSYAGTPFSGSAIALPATIPAANFDKGGEGVAFHDLSAGNLGGLYRTTESVDIIASTDAAGGPNQVTNFQTGEWMNYTVTVPANGNYDIGIRAANNLKPGLFHIEVDGVNVTGSITVGLTGSWTNYQWFGKTGVALTAGKHVVKLVSDQQWFNVSALSLLKTGTTSTGGTTTGGTTTGGTTTGGTTTSGTTTGGTTTSGATATKPANLLFWTGFEAGASLTTPYNCYGNGCFQTFSGTDSSTGYTWPLSLKGGNSEFQMISNSSTAPTPTTIDSWIKNSIRQVTGHKGNTTNALYTEVSQSGCCGTNGQGGGSTQDAFLLGPKSEPGDIYISKWVMLQPDLLDKMRAGDPWRAIFEWKEGKTGDDGAFRVSLQIVAYNNTPLTWMVRWDNLAGPQPAGMVEYYRKYNSTVPVPVGQWFKMEIFWHRSTGADGRTWFAVNGQVIDDHFGPNIGVTNAPINRIFANQVYSGSPYPIYQWTDDMQVWQGWPTAKQGDAWYDPPYAPH